MAETTTPPIPSSYLLHPSDSPSLILVHGILTGDNYPKWQKAITRALNAKNKLGFIDGTLLPPDPTKPEYTQWNQTKDMVLTWILNSISPSLANSLEYHTDPRAVWLDLSSRFCHGNNARIYHLKRALSSLHQTTNSVHDYFNQIKQLWDELSHLQPATDPKDMQRQADDERVFQFLLGLNDSFAPLRTQILAMDPLPSIGKVFSILFQEKQQRLLHLQPPSSETMAMATRTATRPRPPLKCTACGKDGHTRDRCWTLIGYPPGREPRTTKSRPSLLGPPPSAANSVSLPPSSSANLVSLPPELYQKLLNLLAPSSAPIDPSPASFAGNLFPPSDFTFNRRLHWVVDSGASHHICHQRAALADLKPLATPHRIRLPTGQDIPAEGLGLSIDEADWSG
ncbi:hypothetical protein F0562_011557 [Nyssa sinensis]|uniref:CCHC-type domain-containing protein n=1 Tax=Nyssa sinensis TaxID=561372 RepID=A0A5J4ZSR5_9ASTE|nr:hypothetical protein F0562_011557 [Nyssa sinensis]